MMHQGGTIKVRGRVYVLVPVKTLAVGDVVRVCEGPNLNVRFRRVLAMRDREPGLRVELCEHERGKSRWIWRGDIQEVYRWRKALAS